MLEPVIRPRCECKVVGSPECACACWPRAPSTIHKKHVMLLVCVVHLLGSIIVVLHYTAVRTPGTAAVGRKAAISDLREQAYRKYGRTLRGMSTAARAPMERVMTHDITAYLSDRSVSFTKQCFGITSITSRFDGKVFGCRANPFNPLSCTPSISIVTGGGPRTATEGGIATAIFNRCRAVRTLVPRTADVDVVGEGKRAAAEKDD